jgi:glucan 1,3-beta-glucosidase
VTCESLLTNSDCHFRLSRAGGVNLGGWLVLEPWITPSLFEQFVNETTPAVDEWTFTQILGPTEASAQLEAHWDSWLAEDDLQALVQAGITHVRIPVGYWIVSVEKDEPYVTGGWPYLTRALGWCRDLDLKVLIDIHGVPGSQNGFDNSGRRGDIHWADPPGTNILRTYYILSNLTTMLTPWSADNGGPVTGIELVNEPFMSIPLSIVQTYYENGYQIVRGSADATSGFDVYIHDSFRLGQWTNFMSPPTYQNVYLDTHVYHVFDIGLLHKNQSQHLDYTCTHIAQQEAQAARSLWLVTGEWSLATTDCATCQSARNHFI